MLAHLPSSTKSSAPDLGKIAGSQAHARWSAAASRLAPPVSFSPCSYLGIGLQTWWASASLDIAAKLLLAAALEEPANQRFVLLDESAVPMYSAAAVYLQLMGETKSRIHACKASCPAHQAACVQLLKQAMCSSALIVIFKV